MTQAIPQHPLQVAVIGSGPSGFYAAEALLRADRAVQVTMLERLPVPFGLVRSGVAPDHPKLKEVIRVYQRIAQHPDFHFCGNVQFGQDIQLAELRQYYHAVILACGAETDRSLDIPGEALTGSHTATEFVGWYNGHPDYRDCQFDLSQEVAVVIGQGNVAADVCRIMLKPVDALRRTDIAGHALDALAASRIREVHLIGRRGPAQAKFSAKELRELGEIEQCAVQVNADELQLNPASQLELAAKTNDNSVKNLNLLQTFSEQTSVTGQQRRLFIHFLLTPLRLEGDSRLQRAVFARNRLQGDPFAQTAVATDTCFSLDCGLLFRSIGYRARPLPDIPFAHRRGVIPNQAGRVLESDKKIVPGLYVCGWIKRGANGIIGTNRADSLETVSALLEDSGRLDTGVKTGQQGLLNQLAARKTAIITFADWQRIDQAEITRGAQYDKPREKFTRIDEMLACLI